MYDDENGKLGPRSFRRDNDGKKTIPVYRPFNACTPCHICPKIAQGEEPCWENGVKSEITEDNLLAVQHWRECRAVNWQVPEVNDPLVRRTAAILEDVERQIAASEAAESRAATEALLTVLAGVLGRR